MAASSFWDEVKALAEATAVQVSSTLLQAYLNKATGVSGAVALTPSSIGTITGIVTAATVLQHLGSVTPPAV